MDALGLADYRIGTGDPTWSPDPGAGPWNSEPATLFMGTAKAVIRAGLSIAWVLYPDAASHLGHYFGNTGDEYTIRLQGMVDESLRAKALFLTELRMAQAFSESLQNGVHRITSGSMSEGYNAPEDSRNWWFAVGGYSSWGKGTVGVCGSCYLLLFEYGFADQYNWDIGAAVPMGPYTVTDQFMGKFHRQGLAKEFRMKGSIRKTVRWCKGQTPSVTNGWAVWR